MNLETIAKIIGYYFWHCNNDEAAIKHGMELALKIKEALEAKENTYADTNIL